MIVTENLHGLGLAKGEHMASQSCQSLRDWPFPFSSSFVVLNAAWSGYRGLGLGFDARAAEPVVVVEPGGLVLPALPRPSVFDDVGLYTIGSLENLTWS